MFREKCPVLANDRVAPGHYVLRLGSPGISKNARPGQFVQILCGNRITSDPLLPRPFSFLTTGKKDFSILYNVVGAGTKLLSQAKKGDALWVLGPLGRGFGVESRKEKGEREEKDKKNYLLVGGGVGIPPLYHFAEQLIKKNQARSSQIHIFLGARDRSLLLCEKQFKKLEISLHLATDNGSKGKKGFVTDVLDDFLSSFILSPLFFPLVYTCGPTPMMRAVAAISAKNSVPCEVSVEVPMACGFGVCLGCAVEVNEGGNKRFALACTEGPVFKGKNIVW